MESAQESVFASVVLIGCAGVLGPILAGVFRRFRIPSVVFEILLGIIIGPHVLGWAQTSSFVTGMSQMGLAFLMFLAGYEVDIPRIKGSPLNRASIGWGISLVLGLCVGLALMATGLVLDQLLIGLCLTTTAIGTLLPMMQDNGTLPTRWGGYTFAAGVAGEFGPVLAVSILLGTGNPGKTTVLLVVFVAIAVGAAMLLTRPHPPKLVNFLGRQLQTSTQLPVRIVVVMIFGLVWLASSLSLDTLLGAFAAGVIIRLALTNEDREPVEVRLETIGFGLLIPFFFVVSGMNFDVQALTDDPVNLLKMPFYLGLMLVVRGLPALLVYRGVIADATQRWAVVFVQATGLPLIVVITTIGLETNRMLPGNAAALVGAGMLSVLLFPLIGFSLARRGDLTPDVEPEVLPSPGWEA